MTEQEKPDLIIEPTWRGVLWLLVEAANCESATARSAARKELWKMAELADAYVAEHKEKTEE